MPRLTPEQVGKAHWTPVKPGEAIVPLPGTMEVTPSPWVVFTPTDSLPRRRVAVPQYSIVHVAEAEEGCYIETQEEQFHAAETFDELLGLPPARTNEED